MHEYGGGRNKKKQVLLHVIAFKYQHCTCPVREQQIQLKCLQYFVTKSKRILC